MNFPSTNTVNDTPLWRQIEDALLKEIANGVFAVGDRLPGENTLAPHFGVTRNTLRRALTELQNKGILRVEKGRGAFVERRIEYGLGPESSFTANLSNASLVPGARILKKLQIAAPLEIAKLLRIPVGSDIVVFDTIGEASGSVISVTRHHLPANLFPDAVRQIQSFSCITEVYKKFGFNDFRRSHCKIDARLPSRDEAKKLNQANTEPLVEVKSVKTANNVPIDYTIARFSANRVSLVIDN